MDHISPNSVTKQHNQYKSLEPFTVCINSKGFFVNEGKVFNYYNPLNYSYVRRERDGEELDNIMQNLDVNKIFRTNIISGYIDIFVFGSFLPPVDWVPGQVFFPKIANAWIACKYHPAGQTPFWSGEYLNYTGAHPVESGYKGGANYIGLSDREGGTGATMAANLGNIARVTWNTGELTWEVQQTWNSNIPISFMMDTISYMANNTDVFPAGEDYLDTQVNKMKGSQIYSEVMRPSTLRPSYNRGGMLHPDYFVGTGEIQDGDFVYYPRNNEYAPYTVLPDLKYVFANEMRQ